MSETKKINYQAGPVLKRYFRAGGKYPWLFWITIFGLTLIEVASVIGPLFMSQFINTLSGTTPSPAVINTLLMLLAAFSGMSFVGWIGQRIRSIATRHLQVRAMSDLWNDAFSYLMRHSHDYFISNFTGSLTRRVSRYSRAFEQLTDLFFDSWFSTFAFALGVLIALSFKSIYLSLGLFVWCVFMLFTQIWMTRKGQTYRLLKAEKDTAIGGALSDAITNHSTVALFANQASEERIIQERNKDWRWATILAWRFDSTIYAVQGLMSIALEFMLLAGGVYLWSTGFIGVGDFVLIQVYALGLISRVWHLGSSMRRLYDALADANEMVEILEKPHDVQDKPGALRPTHSDGVIAFENVSFGFNSETLVLRDFRLNVPAGQKLAFVGPSGAGKTTVTKLLLRLYDVSGGNITLDGTDIRDIAQESLRSLVSFVPQDPILFHRSLKDNIKYGKEGATDEEIIEAAKKAHCHEFISKLPLGYETHVGERGVKLSGGERQRVAIARAILKNAPVLVLDEATSALDSESEHLIQDALKHLMEGKTVIVIAHRLSTIMKMDRIIVMQDGAIVADGTHDELLAQGELYHKLWNIQAGGFIQD